MQYLVLDNEFNRKWCKDLIGKRLPTPPSYCNVRVVTSPEEKAGGVLALLGFVGLPAIGALVIYLAGRRK